MLLIVILLAVAGFSAYKLWGINDDYQEITIRDEEVKNLMVVDKGPYVDPITLLKQENPDSAGWITYPRAKISTVMMNDPVNQEDFYLTHAFNRSYLFAGEAYVQKGCLVDAVGGNDCNQTLIYGHAMKNGSRFYGVNNLKGQSFGTDDILSIEYEDVIIKYQVVGISHGMEYKTEESFRYFQHSKYRGDFDKFKEGLMRTTWAGDFSGLEESDKLVTLSTCNTHDLKERLGLIAKEVEVIQK